MSHARAVLFVGLFLGLGWAVRGHFGHEWGAAWAGGLGAAAVVVVSGRADWLRRLPLLASLGAVGWGAGGMMSYGRVVGFGRAADLGNVLYGLAMLGVVGALHGFIGGGMLALGLETTDSRKPDWARLLTEMTAGGFLAWGILIYQFEWRMTPPRSELWAGCLGAATAMGLYMRREDFSLSLRAAAWSALGAGIGFPVGNFLQTLGSVSGHSINWWNVMEFTLGFAGGLGMARGVLSRKWPGTSKPSRAANWAGISLLAAGIPFVTLCNAFDRGDRAYETGRIPMLSPVEPSIPTTGLASAALVLFALLMLALWAKNGSAALLLFFYAVYFIVFSHIRKGVFAGPGRSPPEQLAYWVVLAGAAFLLWFRSRRVEGPFSEPPPETWRSWVIRIGVCLALLLAMAAISIALHDGLPGAQQRF